MSLHASKNRLGVVIPTLGDRPEMLKTCLQSLLDSEVDLVVIVSKTGETLLEYSKTAIQQVIQIRQSGDLGAASAINDGFRYIAKRSPCEFATWLGDDDTFDRRGMALSRTMIQADSEIVAVVGHCRILDQSNRVLHEMRPRKWDVHALEFKGNKLPQPGAIFRFDSLAEVDYLDSSLRYAFDQDLFHKLKRVGKIAINPEVVADFKWHPGSLSSSGELESVRESIQVRKRYSSPAVSLVAHLHGLLALTATRFGITKLSGVNTESATIREA